MRKVTLHLPDVTYERIAVEAATVHKAVEQWIIEVLRAKTEVLPHEAKSHTMLMAALDALGFERLGPEQAHRLGALLKSRKERPLSCGETAELQTLIDAANALELASLQRLVASVDR